MKLLDRIFGNYSPKYTYRFCLSHISIPIEFATHQPSKNKMRRKLEYYRTNGEFESPIVLDTDFVLRDGYTSFLIAQSEGLKFVDVKFK